MGRLRSLRRTLGRLERDNGSIVIPQRDGTIYRTDKMQAYTEAFLYWAECLRAHYHERLRLEPPAVLKAVANAKDRRGALEMVYTKLDILPVEPEALVERGELVHRSLVVGREVWEDTSEDLSEGAS